MLLLQTTSGVKMQLQAKQLLRVEQQNELTVVISIPSVDSTIQQVCVKPLYLGTQHQFNRSILE